MQHSFDISIAEQFGVNIAIFLNNMAFWIKKNQANNRHLHDGRYWTYNSVQAYSELFPYWTAKQMRLVLEKAKECGLVMVGNYNGTSYDRTQWYALSDLGHELMGLPICPSGKMEDTKQANGFAKKVKPIPDIKPDIKPDNKIFCAKEIARDKSFDEFWSIYPRKKDKKKARIIWRGSKCDEHAEMIMADVRNRVLNDQQWQQEQFIPYPTTYLANKRWDDDITLAKPVQKAKTGQELALERCLPALRSLL